MKTSPLTPKSSFIGQRLATEKRVEGHSSIQRSLQRGAPFLLMYLKDKETRNLSCFKEFGIQLGPQRNLPSVVCNLTIPNSGRGIKILSYAVRPRAPKSSGHSSAVEPLLSMQRPWAQAPATHTHGRHHQEMEWRARVYHHVLLEIMTIVDGGELENLTSVLHLGASMSASPSSCLPSISPHFQPPIGPSYHSTLEKEELIDW